MKPGAVAALAWALALLPQTAGSFEPLVAQPSPARAALTPALEYLEDASTTWTIEDVTGARLSSKFVRGSSATLNFGITASAYWLRFELHNDDAEPAVRLLELDWPLTDLLTLYAPDQAGGFTSVPGGDSLAFAAAADSGPFDRGGVRQIPYRNPVFQLTLEPHTGGIYYLRLAGSDSLYAPLILWTPASFAAKCLAESYHFGFFFGVMAVMLLSNLLIFLSIRDLSYLYYVLMMLAALLWQLCYTGLAAQHLWPNHPWWANHAIHVGGIGTALFFCCMCRAALMTRVHVPVLDKVLRGCAVAAGALLLLQFFHVRAMNLLSPVFGGVAAIASILAIIRTYRKGFQPARDFVLAWLFCMVAYVAWALDTTYDVIGSDIVRIYSLPASFLIAPIFFARALGRRINALQEEHRRAEALAIEFAERERRESALAELHREQERFVATLTHELRNSIAAISGYHDLLLDRQMGALNAEQVESLEHAERCTRELNDMILATLDLSRFSVKHVKVDWQDVPVGQLIADLSQELAAPADKPDVRLSWNSSADAGIVCSDPLKLRMVLRNLLINALKFTDRGWVAVDACATDGGVEFRVSDSGAGIPHEALPTLFDPFTQAHGSESRRRGGAGLGLHLVHRLVDVLGGTVSVVATEVGKGSTFRVWLPRHQP